MNLYESISQETINSIKRDAIKKEIDFLIKDEEEAIDGYEKSKQTLSKYDIPSDEYIKIVKVYDHIIEEEKEHIRELEELIRGDLDQYAIQDSEKKEIKEAQIIVPESTDDGWGEDIKDLTTDFFDLTDQVDYEIKNARRGSYGIDGTEVSDLAKAFNAISDKALEISETLSNATVDYSSDEDEKEE